MSCIHTLIEQITTRPLVVETGKREGIDKSEEAACPSPDPHETGVKMKANCVRIQSSIHYNVEFVCPVYVMKGEEVAVCWGRTHTQV